MRLLVDFVCCLSLIVFLLLSGCKGRDLAQQPDIDTTTANDSGTVLIAPKTLPNKKIKKEKSAFYGDTIWINPYGSQIWRDTIDCDEYTVTVEVKVDTTNYIIDTVVSRKGKRIVIGYNHIYQLRFNRKNESGFTLNFDKKNDFRTILGETDYWLESNLDVFRNIRYNNKYKMFIVEFDINLRYEYGSVYYFIIDSKGSVLHSGMSDNWGGDGPDCESLITLNEEMYVTCNELFNFSKMAAVAIEDYAMLSDLLKEFESAYFSYDQVHALRDLSSNKFLVVFERESGQPEYNALILNTDSIILDRFRYYGLMEDTDALFLFYTDSLNNRSFIHDTERNILVSVETTDSVYVREFPESEMHELSEDSSLSEYFIPVDFESYGSYLFYVSGNDSIIFYRTGTIY